MSDDKQFDLLLYGATGFTGKLIAEYLDKHPELEGRSWAIAGRNDKKLEVLQKSLSRQGPQRVVCDLDDVAAVDAMVRSARVVISTAGPYSTHNGESLLGACARAGVHYSDLSGEGFWQREMIDAFHDEAVSSGAKIVLGGGVDSIPSDLGAYLALQALDFGADEPVEARITGKYTEYSGSFSGGTIASGKARQAALRSGRLSKEAMDDPYILAPGAQSRADEEPTQDGMPAGFLRKVEAGYGVLLPFFMAKINAPIVRRSLALQGLDGHVSYRECCSLGMWSRISWLYFSRGFGVPLGQPINFVPKSGEGPPKWLLKQGAFSVEVTAEASDGRLAKAVVAGKGDPGYGATSKMLGELALCLLLDEQVSPDIAGVLTPATALGDALVDRLNDACDGDFMQLYSSAERASTHQ
ncbi:saccharopine dehydrogenase family protein [Congregibacter sp.]|uniref:saccharopine dehydrogenase family protein n=1 Tax=Congregibacter sp. TaxID=2744308 RepID=UPI00385A2CCC